MWSVFCGIGRWVGVFGGCVGCGNVFIFAYILKGEDNEQFEV